MPADRPPPPHAPVDIGILTVIAPEFDAAREALGDLKRMPKERFNDPIYYCGTVHSELCGRDYTVVLAAIDTAGNSDAAAFTAQMIERYHPRVVLLMGIAAGFRSKVRIGEVVLSDRVVAYEKAALVTGRDGSRQIQNAPDIWSVHKGLGQDAFHYRPPPERLARLFVRIMGTFPPPPAGQEEEWRKHVASSIICKPQVTIASGDKLLRDPSKLLEIRRDIHRKVEVGEMEAAGFATACRNADTPWLVIRGISDFGDELKDDAFHEFASRAAAVVMADFIAHGLDLGQADAPDQRRTEARGADASIDLIPLPNEPAVAEPMSSFRDSFQEKTRQLLSWPQVLPGERWIERPELKSLLHRIESESSSTTIVLGRPGSGKSALLARLGTRLAGREDVVLLALKADRLPTSVGTPEALQKWLELSRPLHEILRQLSHMRKVVLLVDQLDALSDLVDLSTGRLNVLMGLLQRVAETPNLHIVASCRPFEFRHDVRLRDYQANVIQLELPAWSMVEPVLREAGLDSAIWSNDAREVLRTPQHLKIFLEHFKSSLSPFSSYHAMLEELWGRYVLDSKRPGLDELVSAVAAEMTDTEQLTLPAARFDKQRDKVQHLLVADILYQDGTHIGFTHQTLFEFARARVIISGQEHLDEFVLPRQETLSIRPKLWSCLMYLREVGGRIYRGEFQRLWSASTLRPHLRALMIDFLGQLDAPTEEEKAWLRPMLQDNGWHQRALSAVANSPGWFEWLARLQLPHVMVEDMGQAQAVLPVLIRGWRLNREKVLELIEDCWVDYPEKHGLALKAFQQLDVWNERAVKAVVKILRESPIAPHVASDLASLVSAHAPKLAPQVVAAALERQVQDISAEKKEESEVLQACHRLLMSSRDWYTAADIAASAPAEYLDAVWPWFVRLLERFVEEPHSFVTEYPRSRLSLLFIDEEQIRATLFDSIREAVFSTAEHEPVRFLKLVHEWDRSQVLDVHRLLAQGMRHVAEAYPQEAFEYLLAEPRRLMIGGYPDQHSDSRVLIRILAPQITQADRLRLEAAIKKWRYYFGNIPPASGPAPLWRLKNERAHRLSLLLAIPEETRSAGTRKFVQEEVLALGDPEESEHRSPRLRAIVSPMSSEQMEKAHDEDILGLFDELTDETEWDHPRRSLLGGSIEAAREFAAFAVKHPDRAIRRMRRFKPVNQERPVAYALDELARHGHDPAELVRWVVEFEARGFHSDAFRTSAAQVLERAAGKLQGLDDSLLSLLASWLKDAETMPSSEEIWDGDRSAGSSPTPLFGRWKMGLHVPGGNFPILEALLKGYLSRNPPVVEQAFAVLESHLQRQEQTEVWVALCYPHLIHLLPQVGFERAWKFLSELLARHPRVFSSPGGVYLLERARWKAPPELLQPWVESLRTMGWRVGNQAFGELVALTATMNGHAWAKQAVEKILTGEGIADADLGQLRLGLAFASSLLWPEPGWRRNVTDLLVRLIPVADDDVATAIMSAFSEVDALLDDLETRRLLDAIVRHPEVLHAGPHALVERLGDLLSSDPELIVQVCQAVVDQIPLHPKMGIPIEGLVNLALTLERQERIRPKGLELFERMCQVDILSYGAEEALREADGRLGRDGGSPLRRRPAPRRRRE